MHYSGDQADRGLLLRHDARGVSSQGHYESSDSTPANRDLLGQADDGRIPIRDGREFGGQHHSTVTRSIRKIEEQRRTKDGLDLTIRVIVESIKDIEDQDISDDRARA